MLSVVVLTKNEEKNIQACLESLSWCDEIIIIDDYSTDKTITEIQVLKNKNLKTKLKFKIFKRALAGDFAAQRNFGLAQARGEWVLFVDADERISKILAEEIKMGISGKFGCLSGFYFKRKDKFLGKWLKFGETAKIKLLRLARKDKGKWVGKIHEVWQISGKTAVFKNPLLHQRKISLAQFLGKLNHYSSLRSKELYDQGKTTNIFWITFYPVAKFCQNYFLRLGFLDGIHGLIMAGMMSLHSFMVRAKLWVRQQNEGKEEFKIINWQKYV